MCITELIRVLRNLYLSYGTYTCISEHILVFQILYVYYGTYTCLTDLMLVLRDLFLYYRTYTCITDKEVPVGTTEILLVQKSVGTTERIQRYP